MSGDEVCDDAGESEACDIDCTPAECGDGLLNTTAGEVCDDAGESEACDTDCSSPSAATDSSTPPPGKSATTPVSPKTATPTAHRRVWRRTPQHHRRRSLR